jgi:hypothetical protein
MTLPAEINEHVIQMQIPSTQLRKIRKMPEVK